MNEQFDFKFSLVELNLIIKGLKELPYKESSFTIEKIIAEYEKQAKEAQVAAKKAKDKAETKDSKA